MKDIYKLAYYFKNYSHSLQRVSYTKTGNFFHDNEGKPVQLIYLCPLCLKSKIGVLGNYQHSDCEFSLDHFPPGCVRGKDTILVCEKCNSASGSGFEHALKTFVQEQAAVDWVPGSKVPVTLNVEDIAGNYKAHLIVKGPYSFEWSFPDYPLLKERFERMTNGGSMIQKITFTKRELDLVYRSLLKAAYLYCFSRWKYDFAYSNTAENIRQLLFQEGKHPLTNYGIFFHTKAPFPPEGLCYVFKPSQLQCFMVTFRLSDLHTAHGFTASILIPGADHSCWDAIETYQPIIDEQRTFSNAFILLPRDLLPSNNYFPYTDTWNNRSMLRIEGEA